MQAKSNRGQGVAVLLVSHCEVLLSIVSMAE